MKDIKQTPIEVKTDSCIDEDGNTIDIEINQYDPAIAMGNIAVSTLLISKYKDSGIAHGIAMYTKPLNDKQCTEIMERIKAEPSKYRNQ